MSQLLVVTRPTLVPGFQLAGVEAYGAPDVESAQELIGAWLDAGETGLLAIDDGLLANMDPGFLKRLRSSETLLHLAIPGGQPLGRTASRKYRIAQTIRRAIGFHITFTGEETQVEEQ
jgi:vacuolar-type H+-ATPase subunit F/Vma7